MRFEAKKALENFTPPTFVDADGTEHVGKFVSVIRAMELQDELEAELAKKGSTAKDIEAVFQKILTAMGLPVEKVMALPGAVFWEAMDSFFASHARPKAPNAGTTAGAPAGNAGQTTDKSPTPGSAAEPSA